MSNPDWLAQAVRTAWRLQRGAEAALDALGVGLGEALTTAEQQALTQALYAAGGAGPRPLFPWEIQWFAAELPPPPARLLVAGAGAGAEVAALVAAGYTVAAAEPVLRLARACAAAGARPVWVLDHEGLWALAGARFDAVIFGWGSLTHVLEPAARAAVWAQAAQLTAGPILASFWSESSAGPAPGGRTVGAARRVGALVGRLRGRVQPAGARRFQPWCGFGALVSRQEVEAVGAALGRPVRWGTGDYPHVVLGSNDGSR